MVTVGNGNHSVSIVGYWIFDLNFKKALPLTLELLDVVFSPSLVEEIISKFETLIYTVRYINNTGKLNISD